jgi:hypothetical protein
MKEQSRFFTVSCLVLALGAAASLGKAAPLTQTLTSEEVACNERQLELLLKRMRGGSEIFQSVQRTLAVSYSNSAGFYDGLAMTNQIPHDVNPPGEYYERYLAFNLNPSIRTLLLNPSRPELDQIGLNREQSSSNFVQRGSAFELTVTLDPTLGGGDPLVINNLEEPSIGQPYNGFLGNSTKPGRGLTADGLLAPCHGKLTDFDRHVFSVLQRVVRASSRGERPVPDMEIAIFRGEAPQTYRLDFYPIYQHFEERGRMAAELRISWDAEGRLLTAEMKALPACTQSGQFACSNAENTTPSAFFIPPVFGGHEYYQSAEVQDGVYYSWIEGPSAPVTIDFEALLADSTWNEPVW